jgi:hypothetical protein
MKVLTAGFEALQQRGSGNLFQSKLAPVAGDAAILIDPNDEAALVEAIVALAADPTAVRN